MNTLVLTSLAVLTVATSRAHAIECTAQIIENEMFMGNLFFESACGWGAAVAWSPTNNTAATTKLCQDKECFSKIELEFTSQADCEMSGVNRKTRYAKAFTQLLNECKTLGVAVVSPSTKPSASAKSASAPAVVVGSIVATTALIAAVM